MRRADSNSRGWLGFACASLAVACSSTSLRGIGPFADSTNAAGAMTSSGAPSSGGSGPASIGGDEGGATTSGGTPSADGMMVDPGSAPAASTGACDPDLIYAGVIENEQAGLTWLDQYLSGKVAIYQGQWSAAGAIVGNGVGPTPVGARFESTRAIATLAQDKASAWWDEWRDIDGAWLWVRDTASESRLQIAQPSASPGTTYIDFDAYTPQHSEFQSLCAGCVVDLASRPDMLVTQGTSFTRMDAGQLVELALNLNLELVPPAQLTGETLVTLAYDRSHWSLVSGQWIRKRPGRYKEPGTGPRAAANYTVELFIDDAKPTQHGVRGFRVVACNEQCEPPQDEGDSCP
jgi:hypothetical protein